MRAQRKLSNPTTSTVQPVQTPSTGGTPISTADANAILQESVSTAPALPQTTQSQPSPATPTVSTWTRPTTNPYDNMYADLEKKITENYGNQITSSTQRKDDTLKRIEQTMPRGAKGRQTFMTATRNVLRTTKREIRHQPIPTMTILQDRTT